MTGLTFAQLKDRMAFLDPADYYLFDIRANADVIFDPAALKQGVHGVVMRSTPCRSTCQCPASLPPGPDIVRDITALINQHTQRVGGALRVPNDYLMEYLRESATKTDVDRHVVKRMAHGIAERLTPEWTYEPHSMFNPPPLLETA